MERRLHTWHRVRVDAADKQRHVGEFIKCYRFDKIDTSTPMGMLMFNICAAFSEMGREFIKRASGEFSVS
jgi:hypothetical protein